MESLDIMKRMDELEREIAMLPAGSLTVKTIKGREYCYHRTMQDKKRVETYVDFDDVETLRGQIEKRKALEAERKALKRLLSAEKPVKITKNPHEFSTYVRIGKQLQNMAAYVKQYKKRECYSSLHRYVFGEHQDKVFILYGLRRTGKTTLIRQLLCDMDPEQLEKTAFIQIKTSDTLSDIHKDLRHLEQHGYQYILIDEVTLMEDFIEGAALFSDIYASSGMKIVLSGTDSLGFVFTKQEQLYDRCILLHTTFIPYREFENVLGIRGIDEYIHYGGTMSMGGVHYNERSSFATKKSTDEYIDSAIAHNIQHSLKYYQDGGHFRHLYELYEKGELTSAINRVVEDINHRFTKQILTRTFRSGDLAISARNMLHDKQNPIDLYQTMDKDSVTQCIMAILDILNKENQSMELDEVHAHQIKEYLTMLDLIMEVDLVYLPNLNQHDRITIVSQPGMRYAQADALIRSMLLDEKFSAFTAVERNRILNRILSEVKGRMMEEIVLLETKLANPQSEVFKLQFAVGEFDMVVYHPETLSCEIYEIKYSQEVVTNQYQHLIDAEKCAATEHRFGKINGRYVIYRGEATEVDGVQYVNVEEYLKQLS